MNIYVTNYHLNRRTDKTIFVPPFSDYKFGIKVHKFGTVIPTDRIKVMSGTTELTKDSEITNGYITYTRHSLAPKANTLDIVVDGKKEFTLTENIQQGEIYNIDVEGRGSTYTASNGVKIVDGDIQANYTEIADGVLNATDGVKVENRTIKADYTKIAENTYTASDGVKIENRVIKADYDTIAANAVTASNGVKKVGKDVQADYNSIADAVLQASDGVKVENRVIKANYDEIKQHIDLTEYAKKYTATVNSDCLGALTVEMADIENPEKQDIFIAFKKVLLALGGTLVKTRLPTFTISGKTGGYETFMAALAAAEAGDTILQNEDYTADAVQSIDKAITLNGQGHKFNSSMPSTTESFLFNISGGISGVALKNLNLSGDYYQVLYLGGGSVLTMEGVTGEFNAYRTAFSLDGTATVTNCSFTAKENTECYPRFFNQTSTAETLDLVGTTVDASNSQWVAGTPNMASYATIIVTGKFTMTANSVVKGRYNAIGTAKNTVAHVTIEDSTVIGGWPNNPDNGVAYYTGMQTSSEVYLIKGNSVIKGWNLTQGKTSNSQIKIEGGTFDTFKVGGASSGNYTPANFIADSVLPSNSLIITGGKFDASPKASYYDGKSIREVTEGGKTYYEVY